MNNNKHQQAVLDTANQLLVANNTVTTLEIKNELRKKYPTSKAYVQKFVSDTMANFQTSGLFTYTDNGTFRVYSKAGASGVAGSTGTVGTSTNVSVKTSKAASVKKIKPAPTKKQTSRSNAILLMQESKGHFFSVLFTTKSGNDREMTCQYYKGQAPSQLGYVKVVDVKEQQIKNVNIQTLKRLKINNTIYTIK